MPFSAFLRKFGGCRFSTSGGLLKDIISTPRSPKAIGPYSQAIKANGFIFVSGQLPIDFSSGQLAQGDVAVQAKVVLENVKAIVEAAGSSLSKAVKATIYLKDLNDFAKVNEIYGGYFPAAPPARSTVEVARLPKEASIEIDLIVLS
jgi:2-iminobutanoate/2-iminopropanoate deaminase